MEQPKQVILSLMLKVSDSFDAELVDERGKILRKWESYVPRWMPEGRRGPTYGDYVMLDIDIATGRIVNWPEDLTVEQVLAKDPPPEW